MKCRKCGEALGTNSPVCLNCGAMLSQEQLKIVEEEKRKKLVNTELLTEKYGQKVVYKNEDKNSNFLIYLLVFAVIILIIFVVLLFVSMD